jgi:hypothetical protein
MNNIFDYIVGLEGFLIGIAAFVVIGSFHPLVIKLEYYYGKKVWWALLIPSILLIAASLFVGEILSIIFGVLGAGFLWSTFEIFWQHTRAMKGQCKRNPNREYK